MLLGSIFIWRSTVSNLKHSPAAESACFQLWKMIVVAFLALAHSSFFTMILLVAEEPYLFSLVAYTCLGLCHHALLPLCPQRHGAGLPAPGLACRQSSGQP